MNEWSRVLNPVAGEAPNKRDLREQIEAVAPAEDRADQSKRLRIVAPDALLQQLYPDGPRELGNPALTPISFDPARKGSEPPPEGFAAMWQASDSAGLPTFEGYTSPFQEAVQPHSQSQSRSQSQAQAQAQAQAQSQSLPPPRQSPTLTVRHDSVSGHDANPRPFREVYDLGDELGRGAFSTVYKCRKKATDEEFAAKIIDLRPLRLRQAFKIDRLRREYEIMRRLHNPHIIRLEEVFETEDTLILVMEYCPGMELFDAIIAQRSCGERTAAVIFYQCLAALRYLHQKQIIHRDIKPENILLCKGEGLPGASDALQNRDPAGPPPVVKLLDFGLSKTLSPSEGGSAALTFVGTPCYVAPEVEANAQGSKVEYGTAADLWSAGALLYVMLVARFPEVDRKTYRVNMSTLARAGISDKAQDLIRRLMEPNPRRRLTAAQALQHPWLHEAATIVRVPQTSVDGMADDLVSRGRFTAASEPPMPPQTLALRQQSSSTSTNVAGDDIVEHMEEQRFCEEGTGDAAMVRYSPLGPLTKMQKKVAKCMALAHAAYADSPQVAAEVRRSAIICRTAQVESAALLRRVQQTADSVLDLIPDLQLAVTEMEPELAMEFFQTVRKWVQRLTDEITRVQGENKNSLLALSNAFEAVATSSVADARPQLESGAEVAQPKRKLGRLNSGRDLTEENAAPDGPARKLSGGEAQSPKPDVRSRLRRLVRRFTGRSTDSALSTSSSRGGERVETPADEDAMIEAQVDAALEAPSEQQKRLLNELTDMPEEEFLDLFLSPNSTSSRMYPAEAEMPILEDAARASSTESPPTPLSRASMDLPLANTRQDSSGVADTVRALVLRDGSPVRQEAGVALQDALKNLEGVDAILHHLQNFWSSTEVIFDTLLQRSDHVERFIKFAHKPRLARRFQERLAEYTTFWQQVRSVAVECITGHCAKAAYAFLQENSVRSASETEAPRRPGTSEVEAAPVARESAL